MCKGKPKKVPLKWDGFIIGHAFVSEDGHILAQIDPSSAVGKEVADKLQTNLDHISIKPRDR